ncbi:MAG TPA: hypothetical protein PKC76_07550 [Saprospiraceae bacterium]|nr:hypothetical protein [Saprospiraceae bacterium]HMP23968.1 hypothetical protein [Saprospiraceae bacterium]
MPFEMNTAAYNGMLNLLNSLHFMDKAGEAADMAFIRQDDWLQDTAVIDNIVRRKGTWEIHLLFAHHLHPLKFLSRLITSQACPRRAAMMAGYMRRLAAKDQRGTLLIEVDYFKLSGN